MIYSSVSLAWYRFTFWDHFNPVLYNIPYASFESNTASKLHSMCAYRIRGTQESGIAIQSIRNPIMSKKKLKWIWNFWDHNIIRMLVLEFFKFFECKTGGMITFELWGNGHVC